MNIKEYTELINNTLVLDIGVADKKIPFVREAMQYSLSCGGKRIRPVLCLMFCEACGGRAEAALPLAIAVEYVHTYSLIHDDLPCMDNDDFRRGKPSCHKAYGEAYALLAGDALLTEAFSAVSDGRRKGLYSAEAAITAVEVLSAGAGRRGMIGGQAIDLFNEGKNVGVDVLRYMDELKTGELIMAACMLGCIAANADGELVEASKEFALKIGLAFQITDDILDVTSTTQQLGKPVGSDAENDKSTYVKLLGIDKCRELVNGLTDSALAALDIFEGDTSQIRALAVSLSKRER